MIEKENERLKVKKQMTVVRQTTIFGVRKRGTSGMGHGHGHGLTFKEEDRERER